MSLPPSRREGPPLVGSPLLTSIGAVLSAAAILLHPWVLGPRPYREVDVVSLTHLSLELARRPEDEGIRELYARQLAAVGQFDEAAEVAAPLVDTTPEDLERLRFVIELELGRTRQATGNDRRARRAKVLALLEASSFRELDPMTRSRFALIARELEDPALAARFVEGRSDLDEATRLERSARLYGEAGRVFDAGDRWRKLALLELSRPSLDGSVLGGARAGRGRFSEARAERLEAAIRGLEAAGLVGEARTLAERWMRQEPSSKAALDAALGLEWSHGALERAAQISELRVRRFPKDVRVLSAHIRLALQRGQPADGLEAARMIAQLRPERSHRVRLARIAEWSGRGDEALEVWWDLARSGDRAARREAERLARWLQDERILFLLLEDRIRAGADEASLLEDLVYLAEAIGEPERAREALIRVFERRPAGRKVLLELARLEARMGLLGLALERFEDLEEKLGTTLEEAFEQADLAFRVRGPEAAFAVLDGRDDEEKRDPRLAKRLAHLGYLVGRRSPSIAAHYVLLEEDQLEPHEALRLVQLLLPEGRKNDAMDVIERRLGGDEESPELLLRGLEIAIRTDRPDRARRFLASSPKSERALRGRPAYWRARAQVAFLDGETAEAKDALERVIALDAGQVQAKADLLWLLIAGRDRTSLRGYLARWSGEAERERVLWPAFGASLGYLGRPNEALRFWALEASERPDTWRFWWRYATALEEAGRVSAASRIRRFGLRLVPSNEPFGRLVLGRGVLPETERDLLARAIAGREGAPRAVREAALFTLLDQGEIERVRRGLPRPDPSDRAPGTDEVRLALALRTEDRAHLRAFVAREPAEADERVVAEAHSVLGAPDRSLVKLFEARVKEEPSAPRTVEVVGPFVAETQRRPNDVRAETGYLRLGGLDAVDAQVEGRLSDGRWTLGLEASGRALDDEPGREIDAEVEGDAWGAIALSRRSLRGSVGLKAGFHAQVRGDTVPQLALTLRRSPGEGVDLFARAAVADVVPETPRVYTLSVRDQLTLGAALLLPAEFSSLLTVSFEHHRARQGSSLGFGALGEVRLGRALLSSERLGRLEIYTGARGALRDPRTQLFGRLESLDLRPEDIVPRRFLTAGVGAGLARGNLGLTPNPEVRLRYVLDAWLGVQAPLDEPAYRLEAGVGAPLFGPDELYLRGFFGNVLAGLDAVQAGLRIGYRLRFEP